MKPRRRHHFPVNPDSSNPETQQRYKERHAQPGFYLHAVLLDIVQFYRKWEGVIDPQESDYLLWMMLESPQLSQDLLGEAKNLRDTLERFVSNIELAQELRPGYLASRKASESR